jgi:hypothetical protein
MNATDMSILDMYFRDGMKEEEIARSLNLTVLDVHEALCAFETGRVDIHPDLIGEEDSQ